MENTGAVRAVVEAAGVHNIVSKILGTNNQASNVYATFEALKELKAVAKLKGLKLDKSVKKQETGNRSASSSLGKSQDKKASKFEARTKNEAPKAGSDKKAPAKKAVKK